MEARITDTKIDATFSVGVIVSSDRAHNRSYEDKSGPAVADWLANNQLFSKKDLIVLPDDLSQLQEMAVSYANAYDVVIISGGTGLGPRDVTPQALEEISDYNIPGIGEMLRAGSIKYSLNAYVSRCGGWVRNQKLLLALPGNPKAVTEQLEILRDILPHMISGLRGECQHRRRPQTDD